MATYIAIRKKDTKSAVRFDFEIGSIYVPNEDELSKQSSLRVTVEEDR
jgi:hypothetical protein